MACSSPFFYRLMVAGLGLAINHPDACDRICRPKVAVRPNLKAPNLLRIAYFSMSYLMPSSSPTFFMASHTLASMGTPFFLYSSYFSNSFSPWT